MAEKGGRFDRFLNAIGFVEVEDEPDAGSDDGYYPDDYDTSRRYTPPRNRPGQGSSRPYDARQGQMTSGRNEVYPTRGSARYGNGRTPQQPRNSGGARRPTNSGARQNNSRGNTAGRYDYTPRDSEPAPRPQRSAPPRSRTVMLALQELTDCCDVIDNLIMNNTVVLTMDDMDPELMQRAIDTLSGAVFALHATFRRASEHTFLLAPAGVEVNDLYDPDSRF